MNRHATAIWQGSGKEGKGNLTTQSTVLDKVQYSYKSRFEEGPGTNPEELIAAAHAGCFSMKLSFVLGEAGFTPDEIELALQNHFNAVTLGETRLRTETAGIVAATLLRLV